MKIFIKTVVIAILFSSGLGPRAVFAQSRMTTDIVSSIEAANNKQLERYVEKVLVSAKWGKADNEFGYFQQPEGQYYPDMGPNAIAVDKNENIYILDPVNKRIVVYLKSGQVKTVIALDSLSDYRIFDPWRNDLIVDGSGSIYIRTQYLGLPFPIGALVKIDGAGKILSQHINLTELRETFAPGTPQYDKFFAKVKNQPNLHVFPDSVKRLNKMFVGDQGDVYVVVNSGMILNASNGKIVSTPHEGSPAEDLENWYFQELVVSSGATVSGKSAQIKRLLQKNKKGKTTFFIDSDDVKTYLPPSAKVRNIRYVAKDDSGDKFFLVFAEDTPEKHFVLQYVQGQTPLRGIAAIRDTAEHPFAIGPSGNIYQLVWSPRKIDDGVRVIRWGARE